MSETYQIRDFMERSIEELKKCESFPKVGAVIVKNGEVLSTGYRAETERKHAERNAIEKLKSADLEGSILFTTLEPCVPISDNQAEISCSDFLISSKISKVFIGVLDPGGRIYCEGVKKLQDANIKVDYYHIDLREEIENLTFRFGDVNIGYGPNGKRWVGVVGSGKNFKIHFSNSINESIEFKWQTIQNSRIVDLVSKTGNESILKAKNATSFDQITDPSIYREPSHFSRMSTGNISIIFPPNSTFLILVKVVEIKETDILFKWEVRKNNTV